MPTYAYQAKQGPTELVEGTVEAPSQDDAVARLLRRGLVPVSVMISAETLAAEARAAAPLRLSGREVRLLTRQLTSLLRAKVELVPAMTILKDQAPTRSLARVLEALEREMREGESFSDTLSHYPRIFSPLFCSAIRAGETAGKLDDILIKLVEFGDQQEALESRLRGALAYPILLFVLGLACLAGFIWYVVPRMADLFNQLGGALPWPTKVLIQASEVLAVAWAPLLVGLVAAALAARWVLQLRAVRLAIQSALERLPVTGEVFQARQIARFTRTLQLLLDSGLTVFHAMEVARPTLGSLVLERRLSQAQEQVKRGASVAESLRAARCFPPLVTHLIAVGESAGTLTGVLDEIATYHERLLNERLQMLTSLLEPLMILGMGVLVGFCVLAMVLPIFQFNQMIR